MHATFAMLEHARVGVRQSERTAACVALRALHSSSFCDTPCSFRNLHCCWRVCRKRSLGQTVAGQSRNGGKGRVPVDMPTGSPAERLVTG